MIWIKVPDNSRLITLYTSDVEMAERFKMHKKERGKFYYKNMRALPVLRAIGLVKIGNRGEYMKMMHRCPPISERLKNNQKVPPDLKAKMEVFFEWDSVNKTFNYDKVWPVENE